VLKAAAVLFLFGIFPSLVAYAFLFFTIEDVDHSLHKEGEETWPEYLFWVPTKSAEEYKKAAYREFVVTGFGLLASFVLFTVGLWFILSMVLRMQQ
jgi:hypothetical protein